MGSNNQIIMRISNALENNKQELITSFFGQIVVMLHLLIQNKLLVTFFSKNDYGDWSLLLSLSVLLSMIPFTAFDQAVTRLAYKKLNSDDKYYFVNGVYVVYIILFIFYLGLFLIGFNLLSNQFPFALYFSSFVAYSFSETLKISLVTMDNANRDRTRVLKLRVFDLVYRVLLMYILWANNMFTVNNVFIGFFIGNALSVCSSYKKFGSVIPYIKIEYIKKLYLNEILKFSYPLILWAVFGWFTSMINRWYLGIHLESEVVASYTILVTLSFFVPNAFYGIVSNFFIPYIYSTNKKSSISFFKTYMLTSAVLLMLYTLITILIKEYLVIILADSKYLDISKMIPLLTLSCSIYILAMMSTYEIYKSGQTSKLLMPNVVSGTLSVTLGYYIIQLYGLNGAIINFIIGQLSYAILTFRISWKHVLKRS